MKTFDSNVGAFQWTYGWLLGHDDWDLSEVEKLSADARLSRDEVLAVVGALAFVFKSAAKVSLLWPHSILILPRQKCIWVFLHEQHDVSSDVLDAELQQLGLPKEHSASVSRVFSTQNAKLRQSLCLGSLKLTRNVEVAECGVESVPTTKGNMEMVKLAISYRCRNNCFGGRNDPETLFPLISFTAPTVSNPPWTSSWWQSWISVDYCQTSERPKRQCKSSRGKHKHRHFYRLRPRYFVI